LNISQEKNRIKLDNSYKLNISSYSSHKNALDNVDNSQILRNTKIRENYESNRKMDKKMNHKIEREETLEYTKYLNKFNYILNLSMTNRNMKLQNIYNDDFFRNNKTNMNDSNINLNTNNNPDNNLDEQNIFNNPSKSLNNQNINFSDAEKLNDLILNDYNNYKNKENNDSIENLSIEKFNKILLDSLYELIELIPKNPTKIQYFIDIVKLIDLKKVSDEDLIFYFMEKSLIHLIKANMYTFCHITCKLVRFLSVLKFYVENMKDISFIDNDFFQFLDDHFVNLSKREIYFRNLKNFKKTNHLENECQSGDELFENEDESINKNDYKNNFPTFEKNPHNEKDEFQTKNKRLDSYIKNELRLDKNDIFNINYNIDNQMILKNSINYLYSMGDQKINEDLKISKTKKENIKKDNTYFDFLKDQENNENSKLKEIEDNCNKFMDDEGLDEGIYFLKTGKTVEELEKQINDNNNNQTKNSNSGDNNYNFNFLYTNISNNAKNKELINKDLIISFLIEDQNKYLQILDYINSLNNHDCKLEKRIIMIKIIKINFLIKFYKNFDYFEDPKFVSEILRTYRYLFTGNLDFTISEIIIKRIILLLYKSNYYNSFILAKNVFMILRELSLNKENHDFIREKSEYFKVILNYLFNKISYSNFSYMSFKEIGLLIYMIGETQLGSSQNYEILNKYVIKEMGNSLIFKNMTERGIKSFIKYVNFTLMGFYSNLDIYDYHFANKIIIKFLMTCQNLSFKYLLNLSMCFYKLNHSDLNIWFLLFKHFVTYATKNPDNFIYTIKQVLDYSLYLKKRIPDLDELNKAFANFYLEKIFEHLKNKVVMDKDSKNYIINNQSKSIEKNSKIKPILKENLFDGDDEAEEETIKIKSHDKTNNEIKIEQNFENLIEKELRENNIKESKSENDLEQEVKNEIETLYKKLKEKCLYFDLSLFTNQGNLNNESNIDTILQYCLITNKKSVGFINNFILSEFVLFKLKNYNIAKFKEFQIFDSFNIEESQLNDFTNRNIKEIFYYLDFEKIPNFNNFLLEKIFEQNDKPLIYKLSVYVKKYLDNFKSLEKQLTEKQVKDCIDNLKAYQNILKNKIYDDSIRKLNDDLDHLINTYPINKNFNMI